MKKDKIGAVICVVGRQGAGKTPVVKRIAEKSNFKNKIVYDPRKEYDSNEFTVFYSLTNFKRLVSIAKNSFIIVEEATAFINSFKNLEFTDWLIGCQHNRNIVVFIFHSLLDTPNYIIRLSRFVVLLKTNDNPKAVERERPQFMPYFNSDKDEYIDINNL